MRRGAIPVAAAIYHVAPRRGGMTSDLRAIGVSVKPHCSMDDRIAPRADAEARALAVIPPRATLMRQQMTPRVSALDDSTRMRMRYRRSST